MHEKVKRFPHNDTVLVSAKDTTMVVEILKITKTKGIEIIKNKIGLEEKEKNRTAYIIYCASEENLGRTIISLSSKVKGHSKIKVGEKYKLKLIPYYKKDGFPGPCCNTVYVDNVRFLNVWVRGVNVYTTPDLKGLYYIDSSVP